MNDRNNNQVNQYLQQGKRYYEQGKYGAALNNYNQAVHIDPLDEEVYYLRAKVLARLERLPEALEDLDKALKLNPQHEQVHYEKGNIYSKLGQAQLATESYAKVLEINPDNEDVRAMFAYNSGNYQEAINYFDKILAKDTNDLYTYYYKGNSLYYIGNYQAAIEQFDKALKINPDFAAANYGYALTAYKFKNYHLACGYFQKAQNFADSQYYKAKIYYDLQEYQIVINNLGSCNTAKEYNIGGLAYHKLGQYRSAVYMLEEAIKLEPDFIEAYLNYADLFVELGQIEGALIYYDRAIEIDPNVAQIYYKKSEILSILWKKTEAIECLDKAMELDPERSALYLSKKSREYSLLGEEDKALGCTSNVFTLVKTFGLNLEFSGEEIKYINHVLDNYAENKHYERQEGKILQTLKEFLTPLENSIKEIVSFLKEHFKKNDVIEISADQHAVIDEYLSLINCNKDVTLESLLEITEEDKEAFMEFYQSSSCMEQSTLESFCSLNFVNIQPDICLAGNLYQVGPQ